MAPDPERGALGVDGEGEGQARRGASIMMSTTSDQRPGDQETSEGSKRGWRRGGGEGGGMGRRMAGGKDVEAPHIAEPAAPQAHDEAKGVDDQLAAGEKSSNPDLAAELGGVALHRLGKGMARGRIESTDLPLERKRQHVLLRARCKTKRPRGMQDERGPWGPSPRGLARAQNLPVGARDGPTGAVSERGRTCQKPSQREKYVAPR